MDKIIVEVGSTVTKIDQYNGKEVSSIETSTIWFKKHYKEQRKIAEGDVEILINKIKKLRKQTEDIYICGTSIFRDLKEEEKNKFLQKFKEETGFDFHIISPEKENELTVYGATRNVSKKVAVFIGGGGSSEISIYEKGKILESANTPMGVVDIAEIFPDLSEDITTSSLKQVMEEIRKKLILPKEKADILILAGGGHQYFALHSGISYEKNTLYEDPLQQIMMTINNRKIDTKKYYQEISLDEIRKKEPDPNWWFATRAMSAFVLVIAEEIGANYIVPTDISMVYGLLQEEK